MTTLVNINAAFHFHRGEWHRDYGHIPNTFTTVTVDTDAGFDAVFWAVWDNAPAQDFDLLVNNGALLMIPIPPGCSNAGAQLHVRNPSVSRFVMAAQ